MRITHLSNDPPYQITHPIELPTLSNYLPYVWLQGHGWSSGDSVFESTLGEGDRVSLRETTLEEETRGVWGGQTLEARGMETLWGPSPLGLPAPSLPGLPS